MKSLGEYQKKRKFDQTTEPKGKIAPKVSQNLRFVVHKHLAQSEHYDLRLEVDGVLKSWAVPKGPSLDPTMKHLAVMVEDHPFEYKDFEGVIPKDNYGAGPVMIWDEGFYRPIGAFGTGNLSKVFTEGLEKGHLVFVLAGKKLNGEFALIKLRRGTEKEWLLVKARDNYATTEDVLGKNKSARSGNTMKQIQASTIKLPEINFNLPKTPIPHLRPMLATLTKEPFDDKKWSFEIKWDGYRAITEIVNGKVNIYSRNNQDFNHKFPSIVASLENFPKNVIFDGEVVVVDRHGRSDFQLLHEYFLTGKGNLIYYIFDLLYYDTYNLTSLTLDERRRILKKIIPLSVNIQLSEDIKERGVTFFKLATEKNLEGIIAKRLESTYQPGKRSFDWLKIKNTMQQEAIICGYTKPQGTRNGFGALILGAYESSKLIHIGNVGTGFDQKLINEILKKLKPLIRLDSPFEFQIKNDNITWVEPLIVCEVRFQEWTSIGSMRHPVFLGIREDKDPKSVVREVINGR